MDEALYLWINHTFACPAMDVAMTFASSRWPWIIVAVGFFAYALRRYRWTGLALCLQLGLAMGLSDAAAYHLIKPVVARSRPCHQLKEARILDGNCGGDYGFPSNHASNGMAAAAVLGVNLGLPAAAGAAALVAVVGFSRVYLGVHFPGDVLGGFLFGALIGLAVAFGYRWLRLRLPVLQGFTAQVRDRP